ncbi:TolR protein [Minicystis rosea]|nr:TolR protein [Minicystis rosea]
MAGVDVGASGGKKRATNSEINMVPFIDLLMCTIAFLLITAVWVTSSRINADAQVPGPPGCEGDCHPREERTLHVSVVEDGFKLTWKRAGTVLSDTFVPRAPMEVSTGHGEKVVRYPELAKALEKEWGQFREHFDVADKKQDQIVLHSDDRVPFRELVAVLDATNATHRTLRLGDGRAREMPVFNTTFAVR